MTMGIAYERRKIGGKYVWIILWSCKKTGNVIEEMELGLNKAGVSNIDNSTESEDESTQPAEE